MELYFFVFMSTHDFLFPRQRARCRHLARSYRATASGILGRVAVCIVTFWFWRAERRRRRGAARRARVCVV